MNEDQVMQALTKLTTIVEDVSTKLNDVSTRVADVSTRLDDVSIRVDNVSTRLDDVSTKVKSVEQTVDKLSINQEGVIIPQLELLYEGHVTLQRQMQDNVNIADMQDLKSDVRIHADEIKRINQTVKSVQNDVAKLKRA